MAWISDSGRSSTRAASLTVLPSCHSARMTDRSASSSALVSPRWTAVLARASAKSIRSRYRVNEYRRARSRSDVAGLETYAISNSRSKGTNFAAAALTAFISRCAVSGGSTRTSAVSSIVRPLGWTRASFHRCNRIIGGVQTEQTRHRRMFQTWLASSRNSSRAGTKHPGRSHELGRGHRLATRQNHAWPSRKGH